MSDSYLIAGGTLIDSTGTRIGDIGIADSRIVPAERLPSSAIQIDATGCWVSTGLVDMKTHLGEPGDEAAETMTSGGEAAVLGGYTTVLAMADTTPCVDSVPMVDHVRHLGQAALCHIEVAGAVTVGAAGTRLVPMAELAGSGVRFLSDCGAGIQDPLLMRRALEYSAPLGITIGQRADCQPLSRDGQMHEGEWSGRLGLAGSPSEAEEINVMRDIALVRLTGGRLHFQTLSTAGAFAAVAAAAQTGMRISSEVAAHHLRLCDADLASYDTNLKVDPPLRSAGDARAAMSAVATGRVDAIVTDHQPQTSDRKDRPFDHAAWGSVGLETSLGAAIGSGIEPAAVLRAMSWRPAELLGLGAADQRTLLPGAPADVVVIDPEHRWTPRVKAMATLGTNCAFEGSELVGSVRSTIVGGRLVVNQGKVVA